MSTVILDEVTLAKLRQAGESLVEIRDTEGNLCGRYHAHDPALCRNARVPFTEAELDEFESHAAGRPLADIFRDLKAAK
jgi:hypothetical protein